MFGHFAITGTIQVFTEICIEFTAPSAPPTNVRVTAKNATALNVHWNPPPLDTQNGKLSGYKVKHEFSSERKDAMCLTIYSISRKL